MNEFISFYPFQISFSRFDREFHFPLPSLPARKEILGIHLKSWNPSPAASLVNFLSEKTVGYCGADLKVRYDI